MIIVWLRRAIAFLLRLFITLPASSLARIDADRRCPVCGAARGRLRCVARAQGAGIVVLCEHTCLVCGARCYEQPVLKVDATTVWPAVARDDLERREDAERALGAAQEAVARTRSAATRQQ